MRTLTGLLLIGWLLLAQPAPAPAEDAPAIMLANVYRADIDPADYWVSEKYDGIRAYWDGVQLLTRGGNRVHAPQWFVAGWPRTALDGELWIGRGQFEAVSATVRDTTADDTAWRRVRFMVFDLPLHAGAFSERLTALQTLLSDSPAPWLQAVPQFRVTGRAALEEKLRDVVASGGEGLMLHRASSLYRAERSDDLLKLKPYQDAEARVVGHLPGKGKFAGMLGALEVERPDGLRFRLGSGFTDEQRRHPPPVGSWVTYSYRGLTAKRVPRFASFMRVRDDMAHCTAGIPPAGSTGDCAAPPLRLNPAHEETSQSPGRTDGG